MYSKELFSGLVELNEKEFFPQLSHHYHHS